MRTLRLGVGLVLLGGLAFGQPPPRPLADTREALEQWVQTRQLLSQTRTTWVAEEETLRGSVAMFEKELAELASRLANLGEGSTQVAHERQLLETEKAELDALREVARLGASHIEGRMPALLARLPQVLVERLAPLTARLPSDPEQTRQGPLERLQTVVGILNEIDRFASSLSVETEIRRLDSGLEVEVETLYLGLAQAYFVGEGGRFAGVGRPGAAGWEWISQDDLAPAVQKAVAIYRNRQPPGFVSLPVSIP